MGYYRRKQAERLQTLFSYHQCPVVCSISLCHSLPTVPAVPAGRCHNQPHSNCEGKSAVQRPVAVCKLQALHCKLVWTFYPKCFFFSGPTGQNNTYKKKFNYKGIIWPLFGSTSSFCRALLLWTMSVLTFSETDKSSLNKFDSFVIYQICKRNSVIYIYCI